MKDWTKPLALLAGTFAAACTAIAGLPDVPPPAPTSEAGALSRDAGAVDATTEDATSEEDATTVDGASDETFEDAAEAASSFDAADAACSLGSVACAIQITAGADHTCALLSSGTLDCWGLNVDGQLGNGTNVSSARPVAVSVGAGPVDGGLTGVVAVAAGTDHTCALLSAGTVECWGLNTSGQLGNGTTVSSLRPVAVSEAIGPIDAGLTGAVAVAAGADHTCALLSGGTVECWGLNTNGQLGNGTLVSSTRPVAVSEAVGPIDAGLTGVVAIAAGADHTCVLLSAGTIECWGLNANGQLGNGTSAESARPVAVSEAVGIIDAGLTRVVAGVIAVAAGANHTCALLSGGAVECWGSNTTGQLGNGTGFSSSRPIAVSAGVASADAGLTGVIAITAGAEHTCALLSGGTVECWGLDSSGQLGSGPSGAGAALLSATPVAVEGAMGVIAIAAGGAHTCALVSGGAVQCWGLDTYGQLGDGQLSDGATLISEIPVAVIW